MRRTGGIVHWVSIVKAIKSKPAGKAAIKVQTRYCPTIVPRAPGQKKYPACIFRSAFPRPMGKRSSRCQTDCNYASAQIGHPPVDGRFNSEWHPHTAVIRYAEPGACINGQRSNLYRVKPL